MSLVQSDHPADDGASAALPSRAMTARFVLREATTHAHGRVDALFSQFDLGSRAGYARFLQAQAWAHRSVEAALDRAGASNVIADWPERRRGLALENDLQSLGLPLPEISGCLEFETSDQILGAAYVLEGSRLGGALLRRSVSDDLPTTFLTAGTPDAWRSFVALLDKQLVEPSQMRTATVAALATFATFERSAQLSLEPVQP